MYSIPSYASMIADSIRVEAYAAAMERVITRDSFVLEIGTGIGVFAVMASQMGARRVMAVEPSDAIAVARMLAKDNAARIEFIQGRSQDLDLDERADVIVSDLRGVLPVHDSHFESIADARERLLKPGGTMIPAADRLCAAVVTRPSGHLLGMGSLSRVRGVRLDVLRRFLTNTWDRARFEADHLLTPPQQWADIDYATVEAANICGEARLTVNREGRGEGLAVWFDSRLLDDITLSNGPDVPELIYGAGFFPWPDSVGLQPGDEVCVRIDARRVGDDYVWRWHSKIENPRNPGLAKAEFTQSTFQGIPIVAAKLARGDAAKVSSLNDDGVVERFILNAMDDVASNEDIARRLMQAFPVSFPDSSKALARVGTVARHFSRD